MTAKEKYDNLFGSITSLSDDTPWTIAMAGMLEMFTWETSLVLGVSKTQFIKMIVELSDSDDLSTLSTNDKLIKIKNKLKSLSESTERDEAFHEDKSGYCTAREAHRRARFFSEDYLNAEFNIFLSLSSDIYLNKLYKQYIDFNENGTWSTHGNSGLFISSTSISQMQMDTLTYNGLENILVANELKLGGKKNKDQLLKYCFMYRELVKMRFIQENSKYLLLFISDKNDNYDYKEEMEKEITYAKSNNKLSFLLDEDILNIADKLNVNTLTWNELIDFNKKYVSNNNICQVEKKLIAGFNKTLREKAFIQ